MLDMYKPNYFYALFSTSAQDGLWVKYGVVVVVICIAVHVYSALNGSNFQHECHVFS